MSARFPTINFITAVPAGATDTGTINLPAGLYRIFFYGTQAAATTDPTLLLEMLTNAAQTEATPLASALTTDGATIATAIDLELAQTSLAGMSGVIVSALGVIQPVYLPHGIKWTYTKNGGTAIDLTLVAVPVDVSRA